MGKTAFLFPGQGSQYVGMGRKLIESSGPSREFLREASDAISLDLIDLCINGPEDMLRRTANQQPAILAMSICLNKMLADEGIVPDVVAGHSLGEYAALTASGVLDPVDAVKLVRQRGLFMEEAVKDIPGSMAAVLGLASGDLKDVCSEAASEGMVEVANYNCPGQIVISGATAAVEKAIELAKSRGAKRSVMLQVSGPFHTSLMKPVGNLIQDELKRYNLLQPRIPIVMNYTADYASSTGEISDLMVRQISGSVRWEETLRRIVSDGVSTFVEVGPGKVLSAFVKRTVNGPNTKILSVEEPDDMKNIAPIAG